MTGGIDEEKAVFRAAAAAIASERYLSRTLEEAGTEFLLLTRKAGGLPPGKIEGAIREYWPEYRGRFERVRIPEAAVIDLDAPFGGGPMAPFIVGIHASASIPAAHQELIGKTTGFLRHLKADGRDIVKKTELEFSVR